MKYENETEARRDLFYYIEIFYNRKRSHSYLDFTNPVDFKKQYLMRAA